MDGEHHEHHEDGHDDDRPDVAAQAVVGAVTAGAGLVVLYLADLAGLEVGFLG